MGLEFTLVLLMGGILIWEYGGVPKKEIICAMRDNKSGVIKYLGSAATLSLTFYALPVILLSIYMRSHEFFSYEIFGSQQDGVQVISANVFFNLLLLSVYLMASVFLWKIKAGRVIIGFAVLVSFLMVFALGYTGYMSGRYEIIIAVLFFCLLVGGYVFFWISNSFGSKLKYWWVPMVFSATAVVSPVVFHSHAAALAGNALFQMRVGNMPIELTTPLGFGDASGKFLDAHLLLRTPEFYYVVLKNSPRTVTIINAEHVSSRYKLK